MSLFYQGKNTIFGEGARAFFLWENMHDFGKLWERGLKFNRNFQQVLQNRKAKSTGKY
jgi:hypothetical protein